MKAVTIAKFLPEQKTTVVLDRGMRCGKRIVLDWNGLDK